MNQPPLSQIVSPESTSMTNRWPQLCATGSERNALQHHLPLERGWPMMSRNIWWSRWAHEPWEIHANHRDFGKSPAILAKRVVYQDGSSMNPAYQFSGSLSVDDQFMGMMLSAARAGHVWQPGGTQGFCSRITLSQVWPDDYRAWSVSKDDTRILISDDMCLSSSSFLPLWFLGVVNS